LKNRQGEADFQKKIKANTIVVTDGMIRAHIDSSKFCSIVLMLVILLMAVLQSFGSWDK
jgi:hypothetical protein